MADVRNRDLIFDSGLSLREARTIYRWAEKAAKDYRQAIVSDMNSRRNFNLITGQEFFIFCNVNEDEGISLPELFAPENYYITGFFPGVIHKTILLADNWQPIANS